MTLSIKVHANGFVRIHKTLRMSPAMAAGKRAPDLRDRLESEELEAVRLRYKFARSQVKNVKADRKMRKTYAGRILFYLEIYSGVVGLMVIASGFKLWGFQLESGILASLVGSTAIAAIGLVGFIARGLFRPPPPPPKLKLRHYLEPVSDSQTDVIPTTSA